MCQTHLFTYWVRKAEQNRAPDKLQSAGTQMYGREGVLGSLLRTVLLSRERSPRAWMTELKPGCQTARGDGKGEGGV